MRLGRVVDHVRGEAAVLAHDFQGRGIADLAGEFSDLAIRMGQRDRLARLQEIDALLDAWQVADRGKIPLVEGHALEDPIERVIAPDDDRDRRDCDACLLHVHRAGWLRGCRGGQDQGRRLGHRVLVDDGCGGHVGACRRIMGGVP